jgi:hypothetical protein
VGDPAAVDGQPAKRRTTLRFVAPPAPAGHLDAAELADQLATALRAVRGYVPHHIWWDAGPAQALLAYQALHVTVR